MRLPERRNSVAPDRARVTSRRRARRRDVEQKSVFGSAAIAGSIATGVIGQALLVASGVVVARALGPEHRGLLALIFVLCSIAAQVCSLGVPLSVTYWISAEKQNPRALLRRLRGFRSMQLVVLLGAQAVLILVVFEPRSPAGFLWVGFISLAAGASSLIQMYGLAVLQGLGRFGAFNALRTLNVVLYALGAAGLWVMNQATLTSIALVVIAAGIIAAAVTWLVVHTTTSADVDGEPPGTRRLIHFGLRSLIGSSPPMETFRIDQLLVGLVVSPIALGFYVVALAFTNLARFIGQSIGMVTYPRVAAADDSSQRQIIRQAFALGCAVCGCVTIFLLVAVPWLLPFFFGSSFEPAVAAAQILVVGAFFASLRGILADGTRGSGRPMWGTVAELLTLSALPAVLVVSRYTESLTGVALALAAANLAGLIAILPALYSVGRSSSRVAESGARTETAAHGDNAREHHPPIARGQLPGAAP